MPAGEWTTLGDERLRGVRQKVTILTPHAAQLKLGNAEALRHRALEKRSEAEQVMLLYRNNSQRPRDLWNKLLQ